MLVVKPNLSVALSSEMEKLNPAIAIDTAIGGSVKSSRERLPRESMVQIAGNAPMKLTKPKMVDAISAAYVVKWAWTKIVEE